MPTYEYRCAKCGNHVEVFQSFSEAPLTKHEGCGGRLTKVLSPAGIVLKGSGFYKTDSRAGGKRQKPAAASDGGGKTGTEGASAGSESKGSESQGSESKGSESKSTESGAGSSASSSKSSPSDAKSA
jgi:putative FmdB family regulatory protein